MSESSITSARRRRGAVSGRLTRIEKDIAKLEGKTTLDPNDRRRIKRLTEQAKEDDRGFEERHLEVLQFVEEEDQVTLDAEEKVYDDHGSRLMEILERLEQLEAPEESGSPLTTTSNPHNWSRRLKYLEQEKDAIVASVRSLPSAPDAHKRLRLQKCQEDIGTLNVQLSGLVGEILSSSETDTSKYTDEVTSIKRDLSNQDFEVRRLLLDLEEHPKPSEARKEPTVELPRIRAPTFDGDILNWVAFWEQFEAAIHGNVGLHDAQKFVYLREAVKDGPAKQVIQGLSQSSGSYAEAVECLHKRYDKPRIVHQCHVKALVEAPSSKTGSGKELRHLHDVVSRHLRSLRTMKGDTFEAFLSSSIEMKLDQESKFAWQQHTRDTKAVPSIDDLLEFIDWRAQASELSTPRNVERKPLYVKREIKPKTSYQITAERKCVGCDEATHLLHTCSIFQSRTPEERLAIAKKHSLCNNCLRQGHFASQCQSVQRCRKCRGKHHTMLHLDVSYKPEPSPKTTKADQSEKPPTDKVVSHFTNGRQGNILLMTCQVVVQGLNGSSVQARALLDSGSEASFITERLAQQLQLPRRRSPMVASLGGDTPRIRPKGLVTIRVTGKNREGKIHTVEALVLSKITSNIPSTPVTTRQSWKHLGDLHLADPDYGIPKSVDMLLGADVFARVVLHGRRFGPTGSPSAFKTQFGWVLTGAVRGGHHGHETGGNCYHAITLEDPQGSDELLRKFWEIENPYFQEPTLSIEEKRVVEHFKKTHHRDAMGRFVVSLPVKEDATPLGESRTIAVQRFKMLERKLHAKAQFGAFAECIREYFELEHAEPVPTKEVSKEDNYYMPMHVVRKESSTTTKLRVVFDASAKTDSGSSLNDQFLVGPTVHASLIDVLLRFRSHKVAMTTDVGKMYREVLLTEEQRDLHRFVYRDDRTQPLRDYRMTRLTFGVCASSFAANMALKQNALDNQQKYPQAAKATLEAFYVDDGLVGADSVEAAIQLREELQCLFSLGGFELRKWKASDKTVEQSIPFRLRDQQPSRLIISSEEYVKVLGVEWDTITDSFRPLVPATIEPGRRTKRQLVSEIAKLFDVLGWCSPAIILPKVLLQRIWEERIGWDETVSPAINEIWEKWYKEIGEFHSYSIQRSYFPKEADITNLQLHGFSDASEMAYAGVVYLRGVDMKGVTHVSLVIAKTKVAPIRRMTVPRLELCGALIVARLIRHVSSVLHIPPDNLFTWTDSRVVLGWLRGDPRRFKTFVGNRISEILELTPPCAWRHVTGKDNPADCASRGLYPAQLANHRQWWQGPEWLRQPESQWPATEQFLYDGSEERIIDRSRVALHASIQDHALLLLEIISSYPKIMRVTAWIFRFLGNLRRPQQLQGALSTKELKGAEVHWLKEIQHSSYKRDLQILRDNKSLPRNSKLVIFRPFIDDEGLMRVGGRMEHGKLSFAQRHPVLLPRDHKVVGLLIDYEHIRLLHAGPTAVSASLARRFCIVRGRRTIRAKIHDCITCKRVGARPRPQLLGQLPKARLNPGDVFRDTGVDYAGPLYIKSGSIRKPVFTKCYVAVFVSLSVKAIHLEPVTELTTSAFIATLRRFVSRRGLPTTLWSDNGTNFVGAANEIKRLVSQQELFDHCSTRGIHWRFTPEHAPHFGGLWEAAVKSFKLHLRRVVGEARLTYEELTTTLTQIEACLNSRPLTPLPEPSDALEVLTPGHFLIGKPLTALPDSPESHQPITLLRRWELCQKLTSHFWGRWSNEYLTTMNRLCKWQHPTKDVQVGDIVCLRDEPTAPTKWPIARVMAVHPGQDERVRVVTVRTTRGTYKRPIVKVVPLLQQDHLEH